MHCESCSQYMSIYGYVHLPLKNSLGYLVRSANINSFNEMSTKATVVVYITCLCLKLS